MRPARRGACSRGSSAHSYPATAAAWPARISNAPMAQCGLVPYSSADRILLENNATPHSRAALSALYSNTYIDHHVFGHGYILVLMRYWLFSLIYNVYCPRQCPTTGALRRRLITADSSTLPTMARLAMTPAATQRLSASWQSTKSTRLLKGLLLLRLRLTNGKS
jgi:hypothetical protein